MKVDAFVVASRLGELFEQEAGVDGYADAFVIRAAVLDGTFDLEKVAGFLLADFSIEVK